jgi:hypothetical protein
MTFTFIIRNTFVEIVEDCPGNARQRSSSCPGVRRALDSPEHPSESDNGEKVKSAEASMPSTKPDGGNLNPGIFRVFGRATLQHCLTSLGYVNRKLKPSHGVTQYPVGHCMPGCRMRDATEADF